MKGEKILAFLKIAAPSIGLGAYTQKTWDEHKNNKVDINLKELGVDHSKFDLTEKQHNFKLCVYPFSRAGVRSSESGLF
jgi:hypothetical protein